MNLTLTKVQPELFPASDNLFQNHFWGKLKETTGQAPLYFVRQQTRNSIRRAYRENVTFSIYDAASPEIFQKLKDTYEMYRDTHFYGIWDYPINHKEYTTFCTGESLSIKN